MRRVRLVPPPTAGPDEARAAVRTRDALLARPPGSIEVLAPGEPGAADAELELVLSESSFLTGPGIPQAVLRALEAGALAAAPAGFFAGGLAPLEPCVTVWEVEDEGASSSTRAAPLPGGESPIVLRVRGSSEMPSPIPGWWVHSFRGRRAHVRPEVAALVPREARRVLDVGCGEGMLGASLAAAGARVTGIEPDEASAGVASRRIARVIARPLEEALGELDGPYDAVVAADVIEHLEDPLAGLAALRGVAASSGVLVFSLPNATHAGVLGGLLQGRWDHALEGIVADDHLTYAGWPGWERLLAAAGWRVERVQAVPAVSGRLAAWRRVLRAATGLSEEALTAVQWIGVARRADATPAPRLETLGAVPAHVSDPLGAARAAIAEEGRFVFEVPNPAAASAVATLLRGERAAGGTRRALVFGATPAGLRRRFAGSGLLADVRPVGREEDPLATRVAAAARAAGLAVDSEALEATGVRVTVSPEAR